MPKSSLGPTLIILFVLIAVYFLQVVTPLRLQFDSIILLSSAESAVQGQGFLFHGQPTVFPPAYPALVALLMRLHIAYVGVLVAINIISLVAGLGALRRLLVPAIVEQEAWVPVVCILTLLSAGSIQLFTIPVTDYLFFGMALWCLVWMQTIAASRVTGRNLIIAMALIVTAIFIRRVGVTLIPPFVWLLVSKPESRRFLAQSAGAFRIKGLLLLSGIAAAIGAAVYSTSTLRDLFVQIQLHGADKLLGLPLWRLTELGEIATNVPTTLLSSDLPRVIAGVLLAFLLAGGLFARRRQLGVVDIFLISYIAAILAWPFYATRFWLPVLPFLIAYAVRGIGQLCRRFPQVRYAAVAYAAIFAVAGLMQLAATTVVSFSGSKIGDVYRTGVYDKAYCAAGFCAQRADASQVTDPAVGRRNGMGSWNEEDGLRLLSEYRDGKLARGDR